MFSLSAAVFTKFTQSKPIFNVYRVFRGGVIPVFTNRTLKYE